MPMATISLTRRPRPGASRRDRSRPSLPIDLRARARPRRRRENAAGIPAARPRQPRCRRETEWRASRWCPGRWLGHRAPSVSSLILPICRSGRRVRGHRNTGFTIHWFIGIVARSRGGLCGISGRAGSAPCHKKASSKGTAPERGGGDHRPNQYAGPRRRKYASQSARPRTHRMVMISGQKIQAFIRCLAIASAPVSRADPWPPRSRDRLHVGTIAALARCRASCPRRPAAE